MIRGTQQRSRTNKSDVSSDLNLSTSTDGGCSTVADISRNDSVPGPSHVKLDPAALLYLDSLDSGSETDDARPGWNPKCTDSKAAGSEGLKSIHSWLERESDEEDSDAAAAADDDDDDHHRHHHHHHPANDPTSGATPLTKHRGGTGCISVSSLMLATQVLHRQPLSLERRDRRAVSASPRASRGAQAGKQTGKGPCNIWSPASQEASLSGTPKTAVGHWGGRGRRRSISLTNLDDLRTQEMPPPRSLYPELATQIVSPAGSPTKELDGSCSRGRLLELEPLDASSRDTTIPEAMRLWLDEEDAFPGEPRVEDDEQQGAFMDEQKNLMSSFSRSECLSDAESSSCATKEALNLASNARMLSWLSRSEEGEQDAALDDEQQSEIASLKTSREQAAISPGSNMSAFPNLPGGRPKSFFDGPSTDSLALDRFLEDEGGTFLSPDAEDTREEDEEGKLVGESFSSRSRSFFDSLDRSHLDGERFTGSIKCESMRSWMMEADMEESADMEMLRIAPPAPCDHAPVPPATNRWGGDKDQEHLAETAGMMLPLPPPLTIPSMSPPPAVPHVEMPAPALGKYPALIMDTDLGGSSKQPLIRGRVTPKNGSPRGKVSPASPHSVSSRQQQEHPARSPLTLMETTESSSSDDYEDEARDIFDSPTDEEECPGGSSHGGHDSEGGIDAAILELGPDDQDYIYLTQNLDLHEVLLRTGDLHFGEVDVRRQAYLMRQLVPMRFYRGDVIIQQGDVADSFYIIVGAPRELLTPDEEDGSVVVSVEGPTGGSRDICRLHSGECFGERALVSSMLGKRSASIKAASAIVDVVRVDQMHFNDWVDFRSYLLMKEVPLLAKLPGRSLVALQRTLHWVDFSPRSYIVRQGEEGDAFYMITKGSVEVIEEGADGQQSILVQMYEGQFFGELALIYNEPRNASVRAITNVSCMYLSKENFRGCLNDESFKEVLEEVAYQRELYRERRKKIRAKKGKATVRRIGSNQIVAGGSWADSTHAVIQTPNLVKTRLENGARIINKYEVRSELGRGAYGTVFLCRHVDTHHEYAMKVIDKGRKQLGVGSRAANLRREVAAMKKLRHPNIVTLWEVIDDPKSQHLYMVQEYVECGSVLPEGCPVPPLPASDARPHFIDCLRGLHYLHTHNVIHGDIKPANLIKSSLGVVKIADFGAAVMLSETEDEDGPGGEQGRATQRLVGTPAFMAPELFGEDGISNMSPGSDVWAMGVTLFQMVCGTLPFWFKGCTQMELENIVSGSLIDDVANKRSI
jgi:CRP-like cAMP-binding protein